MNCGLKACRNCIVEQTTYGPKHLPNSPYSKTAHIEPGRTANLAKLLSHAMSPNTGLHYALRIWIALRVEEPATQELLPRIFTVESE